MVLPPPQLESSWQEILYKEWKKPYLDKLAKTIAKERKKGAVYPPQDKVFAAFDFVPYDKVKVVIMGQDPYHGPNQAHGLSFSVLKGVKPPPSLKNIFKEMEADLGIPPSNHGCLTKWANQGVLLLNASLTVAQGKPQSHSGLGWETFTDAVIEALVARRHPVIFVLWGKVAQKKCQKILGQTTERHFVFKSSHPSPFSAHESFLGCRHFSKINDVLKQIGKEPIDWGLD